MARLRGRELCSSLASSFARARARARARGEKRRKPSVLTRPGCFNDVERRPTTSLRSWNSDELSRLSRNPKNELRALSPTPFPLRLVCSPFSATDVSRACSDTLLGLFPRYFACGIITAESVNRGREARRSDGEAMRLDSCINRERITKLRRFTAALIAARLPRGLARKSCP